MRNIKLLLLICIIFTFFSSAAFALNPFVTHIYTADPSAHVFENRVYVYPSHDKDNAGFFDMEDYHVFSSADMINWIDHGVVLRYQDVSWVEQPAYPGVPLPPNDVVTPHPRMWAPDCAFKNSTYYFYFPARDTTGAFRIGVATSKSPCGPFVPVTYPTGTQDPDGNYYNPYTGALYEGEMYIPGSFSMDPCVFVDDDGKAYLFFGGLEGGQLPNSNEGHLGCPYWAELNTDNPDDPANFMIKFKTVPQAITSGVDNWFEGCWIHKRTNPNDGVTYYYLSYSTGQNITNDEPKDSLIHYSMSTNIVDASWDYKGLVIDDVTGWTNHHSFVEFRGDWYAFYHTCDLSGPDIYGQYNLAKRSICVDRLTFDDTTGTMNVVNQTRQGVGISGFIFMLWVMVKLKRLEIKVKFI